MTTPCEEISKTVEQGYETGVVPRTQHGIIDVEKVPQNDSSPTKEERHNSVASTVTQNDTADVERGTSGEDDPKGEAVIVPRSQRRGLLARLAIVPEVDDATKYSRTMKWFITFIISEACLAAPLGSTILFPSLSDIAIQLNATQTVTNLSVALYMLSLSIFPLWWSFFSETMGRRSIYVFSYVLFLIFNVLTAVSNNITWFIIMRILAGGASASVQTVGAGTVADIWEVRERGRAMGYFYLGPLLGPLLAPLIGGGLQIKWGWRSTAWFMVIYGFVTLLLIVLCLPETLKARKDVAAQAEQEVRHEDGVATRPVLERVSTAQSVHLKTKKVARLLKKAFIDPFLVIKYLQYPPIALCVYYASVTFAVLYVLQVSIQAAFEAPPYNFTPIEVGCAYLANSSGYLVASITGGKWTDSIMAREARKANRYDENGKLIYRPEDRMRENAWVASAVYPLALLWYGWTVEKGVIWIVPLIANFFFGFGSMIVFGLTTTMLTEFMPKRSSSGVALNNFCRNICSCVGAFVTQPLLNAIGAGWTFTACFILTLLSSVIIWAMKAYGPKWRKTMNEKLHQK